MNESTKNDFLIAIKKTFNAYNKFGARSNKKLIPIHSWLANEVLEGLSDEYEVKSLGCGGECIISGKYYPKVLDITIIHKLKPVVTISFKFVTSNYAQNSNNYFENLLGETANIRRTGFGFTHFLVLRGHTPYYDKAAGNKRGKEKRTEILSEHQIQKYVKLFKDVDFPHKPDVLGMVIIDFDDQNNPFFTDLKKLGLSEEMAKILEVELSIETFIKRVIALCNLKS
ncbi:MAG: hypothetical protein Q8R05_00750 [Candidatus Omnitrophota bacterium]|nr:hypothetical protein [Candidatus Omnitrophota bacterium]